MANKFKSPEEIQLFLASYPPEERIIMIYDLCELLFLRAITNLYTLGANRPVDLTPDETNEFEAYLTPYKRDEIVADLLKNIEEIRDIVYAASMTTIKPQEQKKP